MKFIWTYIFKTQLDTDFDKLLTEDILVDANNKIVKSLMYIYSMESFIYTTLTAAQRNKDETKITSLGPLSVAMNIIVGNAEQSSR